MNQAKQTVLIVDDTPENIDILVGALKDNYHVKAAVNGELALKIVKISPPDLVLLDIMMPGMDGFEVCRRLKGDFTTRHIPIIFVTAKMAVEDELKGLQLGAVDYITKPISPPIVVARVATHLALYDQNRELDRKVHAQTREINETRLQIIRRLGRAAEYKDNETGLHVIRMSQYARILGAALGMNKHELDLLTDAAPMHDIGKIGIPEAILQKPGKLDTDEYAIMKKHCEIGAEIIGDDDSELLQMAKVVALGHHEKWDGSGYPQGLAGEDIPRVARIVAIADVFDALTSARPYKPAWSIDKTIEFFNEQSGKHFDPQMVPLFFQNLDAILAIKEKFAET